MAAIGRSALVAVFSVTCLYSGAHEDVIQLVGTMAAGLTAVNVPEFMHAFDKDMPDVRNDPGQCCSAGEPGGRRFHHRADLG